MNTNRRLLAPLALTTALVSNASARRTTPRRSSRRSTPSTRRRSSATTGRPWTGSCIRISRWCSATARSIRAPSSSTRRATSTSNTRSRWKCPARRPCACSATTPPPSPRCCGSRALARGREHVRVQALVQRHLRAHEGRLALRVRAGVAAFAVTGTFSFASKRGRASASGPRTGVGPLSIAHVRSLACGRPLVRYRRLQSLPDVPAPRCVPVCSETEKWVQPPFNAAGGSRARRCGRSVTARVV